MGFLWGELTPQNGVQTPDTENTADLMLPPLNLVSCGWLVGWLVCPREPSALLSTIENRDLLSAQVLQRDSEELATRLVPDGSISRES